MGEILKYLTSRSDRARFWRREGSVLEIDLVALRQVMDGENTASGSKRELLLGIAAVGLHTPLTLSAVETAVPGGNARGRAENVSEMTVQSRGYWCSR